MSGGHHDHSSDGDDSHGRDNVWRGFVALVGILLFFFMERCLTVVSEWRRRNQKKNKVPVIEPVL
jgi:solute carrier family 39 (zinc transporter), member 10